MNEPSENRDLNKKFENYTHPVNDGSWEAISAAIPYGKADGFLGDKFATHAYRPSSRAWKSIEAALHPATGKRIAAWWWVAAAAAILIFAFIAFENFNSSIDQQQLAQKETKTEKSVGNNGKTSTDGSKPQSPASESPAQENEAPAKKNAHSLPKNENKSTAGTSGTSTRENKISPETKTRKAYPVADAKHNSKRNRGELSPAVSNSIHSAHNQKAKSPGYANSNLKSAAKRTSPVINREIQPGLTAHIRTIQAAISPGDAKKKKSSPFYDGTEKPSATQVSILAGSQLAFAGNSSAQEATNSAFAESNAGLGPGYESLVQTESQSYSTPVYYGVSGEVEFWNRFAAGLGIGYLQMQKTTGFYNGALLTTGIDDERKYLSIPLYLKFNFIDKPKFSAYTTLGNAYDILVWQKTEIKNYGTSQIAEKDNTEKNQAGNQANIYASLGVSYKFTPRIGVFAEGSFMRYYYTSDSNFYSQKNLWPGVRFGALVSF